MGVIINNTSNPQQILQNIQADQQTIMETQQLLLETLTFVLNSSTENQAATEQLNQRFESLMAAAQKIGSAESELDMLLKELKLMDNELKQNQAMYSTAILEQTNFFKRLITELHDENKKSAEQMAEQSEQLIQYLSKTTDQLQHIDENVVALSSQNNENIHSQLEDRFGKYIDSISSEANKLSEELSNQHGYFEESLNNMNKCDEELIKQISTISQSSDAIHQYLSSLEELMRLVAANQILAGSEKN